MDRRGRHLGKIADVVGVEEELLEAARVAPQVLGNAGQGTVAFVHILDLPVAALEHGNAAKHFRLRAASS